MEELEIARSEMSASSQQEQSSSLAYSHNEGLLASTESLCLLRRGDVRRAAAVASQALVLTDDSMVRSRALRGLHLGVAHLRDGSVDEAARVIGDAADLASRNRSARLMDRLRAARAELTPWKATPAVKELDQRLAAYGLA